MAEKTSDWDTGHARWAGWVAHRAAAEVVLAGGAVRTGWCVATEASFRTAMREFGLPPDEVDRAVRRVRALAEGRAVRSTNERWRAVPDHPSGVSGRDELLAWLREGRAIDQATGAPTIRRRIRHTRTSTVRVKEPGT